jgi:hypothetical protein
LEPATLSVHQLPPPKKKLHRTLSSFSRTSKRPSVSKTSRSMSPVKVMLVAMSLTSQLQCWTRMTRSTSTYKVSKNGNFQYNIINRQQVHLLMTHALVNSTTSKNKSQ